jgi:hypothetical protein
MRNSSTNPQQLYPNRVFAAFSFYAERRLLAAGALVVNSIPQFCGYNGSETMRGG